MPGDQEIAVTVTGQRYDYSYIPENGLWIDRGAKSNERRFFIDYLLAEHRLTAQGIPCEKALEVS